MSVQPAPSSSMFPTPDASPSSSSTSPAGALAPSPEMEQILASLTSHRSVLGYMLLSRGHPVTIIRHSGVVFEGEQGRKYAHAISRIVESVQGGLEEVSGDTGDTDEVRFMRIRTKRHELMISPDGRFLLAVLHDPSS
ncbi:roadblock/LC7 domain-containing protein [Phanerochaete sordida]|uniref:Roadblock/LC7 domain-containing protein n=1 Tax=Phanerochaete sordida TaxID=48140 RepID=A0A9P3LLI3_9APHY|nr:roadblock/LC7 domain-containing protein [Phanerochaete sordida]